MLLWTLCTGIFVSVFSVLLGIFLGVELLGHRVSYRAFSCPFAPFSFLWCFKTKLCCYHSLFSFSFLCVLLLSAHLSIFLWSSLFPIIWVCFLKESSLNCFTVSPLSSLPPLFQSLIMLEWSLLNSPRAKSGSCELQFQEVVLQSKDFRNQNRKTKVPRHKIVTVYI